MPQIEPSAQPRRLRVLVVDDDAQVASVMARVLAGAYEVTIASSVRAAQRALDQVAFDLVVSDVFMPVLTGLDLYEWLRARSPALAERVVFVTGGTPEARVTALLERLPNPRLGKPFGVRELKAAVDAMAARVSCDPPESPS